MYRQYSHTFALGGGDHYFGEVRAIAVRVDTAAANIEVLDNTSPIGLNAVNARLHFDTVRTLQLGIRGSALGLYQVSVWDDAYPMP